MTLGYTDLTNPAFDVLLVVDVDVVLSAASCTDQEIIGGIELGLGHCW
jgi:hypothetical protein